MSLGFKYKFHNMDAVIYHTFPIGSEKLASHTSRKLILPTKYVYMQKRSISQNICSTKVLSMFS